MVSSTRKNVMLTPRQRRAIPLILGARSIEEGCRTAGISPVTWYAWLKDEGFKAEVDRQREAVISEALDGLKGSVRSAVEGLKSLLDVDEKNIRLRACGEVVDYFLKAREIEGIERRLDELEKIMKKRKLVSRAGKRTTRLEERACRFKAVPGVEIKLLALPSGGSTMARAGSVIDLPGGARFRLPRSGLAGALIVLLQHFYREGGRVPHLPDPRKEIVRQAAQGKRFIAVNVPWKIEEERAS